MPLGNALNSTSATSAATYSTITLGANTTIALWLYFTGSTSNYNCLFGNDIWYHGSGAAPGKLQFKHSSGTLCFTSTTNVANDANWHHYVLTDNGSSIHAYLDTVDMGNSTTYHALNACTTAKLLQAVNSSNYMGLIDEVSIWSRVLSAGEISTLYGAGSPPSANLSLAPWNSGLTVLWSFDAVPTWDGSFNGHTISPSNISYASGIVPLETMPSFIRDVTGEQCVVGALQGVCIGDLTSMQGDTFDRHLQTGVREELVEGYPSPPCLALDYPGFWRFRWQVVPGTQTISVWTKQVSNVASKRSTMIVKANPATGLAADVVGTAGAGTGWVKIGPLSATVSSAGVLYVELHNNDTDTFYSTAYFDSIGT